MAYADYIDAPTLQDTCDALATNPPGKLADCRFLGQAEPATTAVANRPHRALAENMDNLKLPMDSQVAIVQVGVLTGFAGNQITIDPAGGPHDLDAPFAPVGFLYMGNGNYAGANPEDYNTLFQLLDSGYNEVLVGGAEVVISGIAVGAALGTGFTAVAVTLQLSAILPAGNYLLAYARDASLATLPDDALIRANIRGLHEAAAEGQYNVSYVCGINTNEGPVDFLGADAIVNALASLPATLGNDGFILYVRDGTYNMPAAWPAVGDNIRIIGVRGRDHVTLDFNAALDINEMGVVFEHVTLDLLAGFDLTFSNPFCELRHVTVIGDGTNTVTITSNGMALADCYVSSCGLFLDGGAEDCVFERVLVEGGTYALRMHQALNINFRACKFLGGTAGVSTGACWLTSTERVTFDDCEIIGSAGVVIRALALGTLCTDIGFNQCRIRTRGSVVRGISYEANNKRISFNECEISSEEAEVIGSAASPGAAVMSFRNCKFSHEAVGPPTLNTSFAVFRGDRITLENCEFFPAVWDPNAATDHCVWFDENVRAKNILLDMSGQQTGLGTLTVDYEWFVCNGGSVDGIVIDQGTATTITTPTALADRLIYLHAGAHVQDLRLLGIGGDMLDAAGEPTLIEITGGAGLVSKLDGCAVQTRIAAPLWIPATAVPAVCLLSGAAEVRRLHWMDQSIEPASVVQSLVGMTGSNNLFEDCYVSISGNNDDIRRCFLIEANGYHNRILNNVFWLKPLAQNGVAGPFYQCVEIIGLQHPTGGWGKGQAHGQFVGNTVRFVGYTQDNGALGYMLGGPVVFGLNAALWAIEHNSLVAVYAGATGVNPIRQFMFIHEGAYGQIFNAQNRGAGGCSVSGNITRAEAGIAPDVSTDAATISFDAAAPTDVMTAGNVAGGAENAYLFD